MLQHGFATQEISLQNGDEKCMPGGTPRADACRVGLGGGEFIPTLKMENGLVSTICEQRRKPG